MGVMLADQAVWKLLYHTRWGSRVQGIKNHYLIIIIIVLIKE